MTLSLQSQYGITGNIANRYLSYSFSCHPELLYLFTLSEFSACKDNRLIPLGPDFLYVSTKQV